MSSPPRRPNLSDPATTPRIAKSGDAARERPIWEMTGGVGDNGWEVKVTPILGGGAGGEGAQLGGGRQKPRAVFEVRAQWKGPGLPEFGSIPGTTRITTYQTEDHELAEVIARMASELLREGSRDFLLNVLAERAKRRG